MAILNQDMKVQIEIALRGPAAGPPVYGLRLLCNGRPPWNPALVHYGPDGAGAGWLWDTAAPGPSLLDLVAAALRDGRPFRWETRPGGLYLFAVPGALRPELGNDLKYFFDDPGTVMVMLGIGSALLAAHGVPSGSGLGWRLAMNRAELRQFAADLRREWQEREV